MSSRNKGLKRGQNRKNCKVLASEESDLLKIKCIEEDNVNLSSESNKIPGELSLTFEQTVTA